MGHTSSSSSLRDKEAEESLRLRNFEPDWETLSERERKGRERERTEGRGEKSEQKRGENGNNRRGGQKK